jgi:protocatechuate 3,4-dioxygenase beta subunit
MEDIKSFVIYLVALVGLIGASLLFANQGEPPEITPLPTTPSPTKISQAATPSAVDQPDSCADAAQGAILNDVPDGSPTTNSEDRRLSISGTIYASDGITPLPGALIKVWREMPREPYRSYLHRIPIQTEASGRYTFTTINPRPGQTMSVRYQVSYHDRCLFSMSLKIITASLLRHPFATDIDPSAPMPAQSPVAQFSEAGPMFHGPVDLVLPVPPPVSFRANLIPPDVAGEPLIISGVVYAADRETPLPGARVEVWQANPTGSYEGYDYPAPAFNLQGQMRTNAAGRYEFTTLKPGPVKGGQTDLPAQIHFKVTYQDKPWFTRMFLADDPFLNNNPASSELIIPLSQQIGPTSSVWQGRFDIVLTSSLPNN